MRLCLIRTLLWWNVRCLLLWKLGVLEKSDGSYRICSHRLAEYTEYIDISWWSYIMCWHRLAEYTKYIEIVWWKLQNVLTLPGGNIQNILILTSGSYRMCWHHRAEYTEYINIVWWELQNVLTSFDAIYIIYWYYLVEVTKCIDIAW